MILTEKKLFVPYELLVGWKDNIGIFGENTVGLIRVSGVNRDLRLGSLNKLYELSKVLLGNVASCYEVEIRNNIIMIMSACQFPAISEPTLPDSKGATLEDRTKAAKILRSKCLEMLDLIQKFQTNTLAQRRNQLVGSLKVCDRLKRLHRQYGFEFDENLFCSSYVRSMTNVSLGEFCVGEELISVEGRFSLSICYLLETDPNTAPIYESTIIDFIHEEKAISFCFLVLGDDMFVLQNSLDLLRSQMLISSEEILKNVQKVIVQIFLECSIARKLYFCGLGSFFPLTFGSESDLDDYTPLMPLTEAAIFRPHAEKKLREKLMGRYNRASRTEFGRSFFQKSYVEGVPTNRLLLPTRGETKTSLEEKVETGRVLPQGVEVPVYRFQCPFNPQPDANHFFPYLRSNVDVKPVEF